MIALSCDPVTTHNIWIADIKVLIFFVARCAALTLPHSANVLCTQSYACYTDDKWPYPLIADPNRDLAVQLGMIDPVAKDRSGIPQTCRAVSNAIYI